MVPFFSIGTFFTGIVAQHMGGVDISRFIGLPVAGVLYWLFTRNLDLAAERAPAEQQAADLENAAPEGEDLAGVIVD